jgi:hypothetical protein
VRYAESEDGTTRARPAPGIVQFEGSVQNHIIRDDSEGTRRRITACVCLLIAFGACYAADNPITNGGFEALDEKGGPVGWELLGDCRVTGEAHAGEHAMLLERDAAEGLCGLNRVWEPGSGRQGTMLSELRGGVRFWYRADEASSPHGLVFYVIPMSDEPLEVGGLRASYTVPPQHVGDGQWREGAVAYDYSDKPGVRWVQVSPRLRGERARMFLDDVTWVDHIGPMPAFKALELSEPPGREGRECVIEATLTNSGDRPTEDATVSIAVPEGLTVEGDAAVPVAPLAPDDTKRITWTVIGERDRADRISVTFEAGERVAANVIELAPRLEVVGLLAAPAVPAEGDFSQVELVVRNRGNATVTGPRNR